MVAQVKVSSDQIRRVARMYNNTADASKALGIAPATFRRLCRKHNIKPRWDRNG